LSAIAGAALYLISARSTSIEESKKYLAQSWTNEGSIDISEDNKTVEETRFISLKLYDHDGDLIGTLTSLDLQHSLDVHANVGWFSTELHIHELNGCSISPVA
jgi:hypothetical protein